ncbi:MULTISPECIES: hypothetical protein [unclassified Agarivorans]|uniref:hypothetical protein n=1 Tax=unclassified Agarivorans TaxID=2636026 RepID=UPI0026E417A8|nr:MULTISPECIES: hypothetical protein [unclassified Agarivorans]MDO6684943.1 hypothetical protein [Agarivorans sp. 3_MG-2023]MDO6714896.1 hypothetical protein [Agarivorans sp. 2_MG-2023]
MKGILIPALISVLAGCGGGDSSDSSNTGNGSNDNPVLADEYLGAWESSDNSVIVSIGKSAISAYVDTEAGCFGATTSAYSAVTENSFTTVYEGTSTTSSFSIGDSGQLNVKEGSLELSFNKLSHLPSVDGCDSGNITLSLELAELPTSFKVNRNAQMMNRTEIIYTFLFDLDKTGTRSSGDFSFSARYNKNSETEKFISINDLTTTIGVPQYMPGPPPEENLGLYDLVHTSQTGSVSTDSNIVSFTIARNVNPLLSLVNLDTPVKVTSYLSYPKPETESVWSGTVDGPWNWTDDLHADLFPNESVKYQPIDWLNTQTDAEGDQSGQSQWIDIKSVSISIAN